MRHHAASHDQFGRALRPARTDDYRPAPAPRPAAPTQCVHGRDETWIPRCTQPGTWRIPYEYCAHHDPAFRVWVTSARWCAIHKPAHAIEEEAA